MGFVLNSNLTEIDGFYVVFMLYALFQFLLAFFALSQIPAADHLTLNLQHTYEVHRLFSVVSSNAVLVVLEKIRS